MKKVFYILSAALMLVISSCDDFLGTLPDNRTIIDTPQAASELLTSGYTNGNLIFYLEPMTDNVTDRGAFLYPGAISSGELRINEYGFKWQTITDDFQQTPNWYWNQAYGCIAAANHALQAIAEMESKGMNCDSQKGEAYMIRAYNHFMLVNVFAQHYNPATADQDLGIAYVTEPEDVIFGSYERASVAEVYKRIGEDIEAGFDLINDASYGDTPKYHFTKTAAAAFICRYYLYMGVWDKAEYYANLALGANPALRDWVEYNTISINVRQQRYTSVVEPANILLTSTVTMMSWFMQPFYRYGYSIAVDNEMLGTKNMVGMNWAYRTESYQVSSESKTFTKWAEYFKSEGLNANVGNYYLMQPLFTTDEVITNRIEALAMQGKYSQACEDIKAFFKTKILGFKENAAAMKSITPASVKSYYSTYPDLDPFYKGEMDEDKMAFVKCAVDLRRHDQLQEGSRWFDIKRFDIEVTHTDYNSGAKDVLKKKDLRRAIQIPATAIEFGITPNPR